MHAWPEKAAIYARVSSPEHRENLERQTARLADYCAAQAVKEIASGMNDSRPRLLALLNDTRVTRIVVAHRDRLTRFGFHYLEALLQVQGRTIDVVNLAENDAENDKEDLIADLVAIVYSFIARLYSPRRAKRTTPHIAAELCKVEAENDATR